MLDLELYTSCKNPILQYYFKKPEDIIYNYCSYKYVRSYRYFRFSDLMCIYMCVYNNLAISSKLNFSTYVATWLHNK